MTRPSWSVIGGRPRQVFAVEHGLTFLASPDWVWCDLCRMPLNAMREVEPCVYEPSPNDFMDLGLPDRESALNLAQARLEGHRRQYHPPPRKSLVRGRPPSDVPRPWHYIIFKCRDAKDGRRWNHGMHATIDEEPWPMPSDAIQVRKGRAFSHEQAHEIFVRVGMGRQIKDGRRQARVRFSECATCKNSHSSSVEHYTCPRCRRFTFDARRVPGYPERRCRAGCDPQAMPKT